MIQCWKFVRSGAWNEAEAVDRVLLDSEERRRRRVVLSGANGLKFLLNLSEATALKDGDALVLDNGNLVRICAKPETLTAIVANSPRDLTRLAWHIGNRHVDMEVAGDELRIRSDHVLETMLVGLGAQLRRIEAPFEPESGAYAQGHVAHAGAHER